MSYIPDMIPRAEAKRMCVVCGMTVPASHDRIQPGPGCNAPDACTFDMTDREAWQYWRQKYHDLRAEADVAEAKGGKDAESDI